jgi:hypothetical protein
MNFVLKSEGYDISIEVNRQEDNEPDEKPRFRTGFSLPEKNG